MPKKSIKIYLETTIPNYLFADDTPRERDITKKFWNGIKKGRYDYFISKLLIDEIERTRDLERRKLLLNSIEGIRVLSVTEESKKLADLYISKKIIPSKYEPDAMHCNSYPQ